MRFSELDPKAYIDWGYVDFDKSIFFIVPYTPPEFRVTDSPTWTLLDAENIDVIIISKNLF